MEETPLLRAGACEPSPLVFATLWLRCHRPHANHEGGNTQEGRTFSDEGHIGSGCGMPVPCLVPCLLGANSLRRAGSASRRGGGAPHSFQRPASCQWRTAKNTHRPSHPDGAPTCQGDSAARDSPRGGGT